MLVAVWPGAAAQEIDHATELSIRKRLWIGARIVFKRVGEVIAAVGHDHMIVVEESVESQTDEMVHPVAVEIVMQLVDDIVRCRDVFQLAQHAMPAVGNRVLEQQAFLLQLDVIRAPRRTQDCNDHADDRQQHDHGNRDDTAGALQHGIAASTKLSKLRDGCSPHSQFPGGLRPLARTLRRSACQRLVAVSGEGARVSSDAQFTRSP